MVDTTQLQHLTKPFYEQSVFDVAKSLIGCYLVLETDNGGKVGEIIETEAYPGIGDRASHSHKGLTKRTEPLFGEAGRAYVYLIYGGYYCFNVVCDTPSSGAAVLIRAVRPLEGLAGKTSGPGLVCKSYGIDKQYNTHDLTFPPLQIFRPVEFVPPQTEASKRIGVDYAGPDAELLYRFKLPSS